MCSNRNKQGPERVTVCLASHVTVSNYYLVIYLPIYYLPFSLLVCRLWERVSHLSPPSQYPWGMAQFLASRSSINIWLPEKMDAGMGLERVRDKIMQWFWSGVGRCWNEIQRAGEAISFKEKLDLGCVRITLAAIWKYNESM